MERVSAQQLQQWVAEARQRWNVPGIAVGVLWAGEAVAVADGVGSFDGGGDRFDFPREGFVNMVALATRVP